MEVVHTNVQKTTKKTKNREETTKDSQFRQCRLQYNQQICSIVKGTLDEQDLAIKTKHLILADPITAYNQQK